MTLRFCITALIVQCKACDSAFDAPINVTQILYTNLYSFSKIKSCYKHSLCLFLGKKAHILKASDEISGQFMESKKRAVTAKITYEADKIYYQTCAVTDVVMYTLTLSVIFTALSLASSSPIEWSDYENEMTTGIEEFRSESVVSRWDIDTGSTGNE